MAQITHTNPNGRERFEIRAELSHMNVVLLARSYAGITIFREVLQTTWFGRSWVRSGNPGTILNDGAFLDALGNDITNQLSPVGQTNNLGHFERFFLFFSVGQVQDSGNDARRVRRVRCQYRLPWDNNTRTLEQA